MQQGKIAKIISEKGFGFITREGESKDLFFHINDVQGDFDSFTEGDTVSFDVVDGPKGPAAVQVTKM